MMASPARTRLPSMTSLRSTTPTQKPGQVIVRAVIHAGHLGRLTADQRATGLHAALGDAGNDRGGHVHRQLSGGVVIKEEQRLRALHGHVVDAHGDEVDADAVMAAGVDGQPQLRAHAVGAGDQHRFPVALREADQGAESANTGQYLGSLGTAHQRLDALDQLIASVDIDAGVAVCEATGFLHVERFAWMVSALGRLRLLYRSQLPAASCATYPTSSACSALC